MNESTIDQLTATVHVVRIGARELTLTKYRQLDLYHYAMTPYKFRPFGRVNAGSTYFNEARRKVPVALEILGSNCQTGALERIVLTHEDTWRMNAHPIYKQTLKGYRELPLIVLGGIR